LITVVDSNVIVALWDADDSLNLEAQNGLDAALKRGSLLVPAPVYAELMASPGRTEGFLDTFFRETGITVEWAIEERIWRSAGRAFQKYAARRRKQREPGPRRILADFLIGACASRAGYQLLTLDDGIYRAAFPEIRIAQRS
jgi:predicted nucleic acid-binding protein